MKLLYKQNNSFIGPIATVSEFWFKWFHEDEFVFDKVNIEDLEILGSGNRPEMSEGRMAASAP